MIKNPRSSVYPQDLYRFQESLHRVDRKILFEILQNGQVPYQVITAVHNIFKRSWIAVNVGSEYLE
jgi:hypothetical protein